MATNARPTPEQASIIVNGLLRGDTVTNLAYSIGKSYSWVRAVAYDQGLVRIGPDFGRKWIRKGDEAAYQDELALRQLVAEALLNGGTRDSVAAQLGVSPDVVRRMAVQERLTYEGKPPHGRWIRMNEEQPTMTDDTWNLTLEEYNDVITPERERNGTPPPVEATDAETPQSSAAAAVEEAMQLLEAAREQRVKDKETIRSMQTRIEQLETEVNRLNDKIKVEISRAETLKDQFDTVRLRQSMAALKAELA